MAIFSPAALGALRLDARWRLLFGEQGGVVY